MSHIKRYFEEHIDEFTDEQLSDWGWSSDDIKMLRECFSKAERRINMYNYQYPDCDGCKYEDSYDISIHTKFCLRCKRGYFNEEDQDIHEDLYVKKED